MTQPEIYFSVDIEASGPIPGEYSMLSLGACLVDAPDRTFYAELQPISQQYVPDALRVSRFDLQDLARTGQEPRQAGGDRRFQRQPRSAHEIAVPVSPARPVRGLGVRQVSQCREARR